MQSDNRAKPDESSDRAVTDPHRIKVGETTPNPLPGALQAGDTPTNGTADDDRAGTKPFPDDPTAEQRQQGLSPKELKDLELAGGAAGGMQAGSGSSKSGHEDEPTQGRSA